MGYNKSMKIAANITTGSEAPSVEKMFMENTLLRIAGALFCHDAKRASKRIAPIVLNRGTPEKLFVIEPHPKYGQPGPLAHKIFVALLKKHSDYGRPAPNQISFGQRELIRLIGRAQVGGHDSDRLIDALRQIRYAHVVAHFKKDGRMVEHDFSVFDEIMIERRATPTDPIVACTVRLADPIIASLRDEHFVCFNYSFLRELGTIGQAIYMRLFFHFANLYEQQRGKRGLLFKKRYDDICREWLGGLAVRDRLSHVRRDQLGPHLDQLVAAKFLSSFSIETAKTREGFVITFRPGAAFFSDYEMFYRHRKQGELQWNFQADQRDVAEPLKLAYLFIEKRVGQPIEGVPYVSSNEVGHAKNILARIGIADAPAFIDFALRESRRTNFDPQSLAGIAQYVETFLKDRKRRGSLKAAADARAGEERERRAYDAFRRAELERILAGLADGERTEIENEARKDAERFSGNTQMYEAAKLRVAADRHGDALPTFEEWRVGSSLNHRI
jgi:hypothetical protein